MRKPQFDLINENFNYFFANECAKMDEWQKRQLPEDLNFKLFRSNGVFNVTATDKFHFVAKLFILWKALNKRIYIVVEDQQNGIGVKQFEDYKAAKKKGIPTIDVTEQAMECADFVVGSKELCDTLAFLNNIYVGPAYNYLAKSKNTVPTRISVWKQQMNYIMQVISRYESQKKIWALQHGFLMSDWYVLVSAYYGGDVSGSQLYKATYRKAFNSSVSQVKLAFGRLQKRGYIEKIGQTKNAIIRITPEGSDIVNQIVAKYIVNF